MDCSLSAYDYVQGCGWYNICGTPQCFRKICTFSSITPSRPKLQPKHPPGSTLASRRKKFSASKSIDVQQGTVWIYLGFDIFLLKCTRGGIPTRYLHSGLEKEARFLLRHDSMNPIPKQLRSNSRKHTSQFLQQANHNRPKVSPSPRLHTRKRSSTSTETVQD